MSLLRAVIRCECRGCSPHSRNRCKRTRGSLYRGRHPVTVRQVDGVFLCHLCLNRRLERQLRRLYPEIIPLPEEPTFPARLGPWVVAVIWMVCVIGPVIHTCFWVF